MTLQIMTNPISGAEMIIPTTELAQKIHEVLSCVSQITDWENHCDAFGFQQKILEILETKGLKEAADFVRDNSNEIDEVFFHVHGKSEELLSLLIS